MRSAHIVSLLASVSLASIGGVALAETKAPAPADQAPSSLAQAQASTLVGTPVASMRRGRNGKAGRKLVAEKRSETARSASSVTDALSSCIAIWDRDTHMTKREWARACQRVAERLKDTTIK